MKFRRTAVLVATLIAALTAPALASQKIVLTAASGFPRGHLFSQNFERFIEEVNKRGNGTLEIDYKGGAPTIGSPFTLGQRVQRGQFDMMSSTGPYYESTVPEALALILVYVFFSERIGFIPLSIAILLILFWRQGIRLGTGAAVAVVATLAIQFAFSDMLRVPLPRGLLAGYLW